MDKGNVLLGSILSRQMDNFKEIIMKFSTSFKKLATLTLFSAFLAAPAFAQAPTGQENAAAANTTGTQNSAPAAQCPNYQGQMPPCYQNAPGRGGEWGPGHRGRMGGMNGNGYGRHHGPRGAGDGMGPRGGRGGRGGAYGQNLLTPEERMNMRAKMGTVKTYDECVSVQTEHRGIMESRAKEKGVELQMPRQNRCDVLKARGVLQ